RRAPQPAGGDHAAAGAAARQGAGRVPCPDQQGAGADPSGRGRDLRQGRGRQARQARLTCRSGARAATVGAAMAASLSPVAAPAPLLHRYPPGMPTLFLGLISGTSADGIDAALVELDDTDRSRCRLLAGRTFPWDPDLRATLVALGQGGEPGSLDELGELDARVAIAFAEAANALLRDAGVAASRVAAIGSHGQTVRHRPHAAHPFTMQIGNGSRIAELTGITTVSDLRSRDIAAGGHGAPLLPALHAALLAD